jgi:hypothetical protein
MRSRSSLVATAAIALCGGGLPRTAAYGQVAPAASKTLPARLTDQEFWKFTVDMSEPEGYFSSENLLSNETGYQWVLTPLLKAPRGGKVYMGVGPEQNFTYIAALKPQMAIIVDIRRGNLLGHMLYKALFELSADRAEFISRLFSKPRPAGLDTASSAQKIMDAYYMVYGDSALYVKNRKEVFDLLLQTHKFGLSSSDTARMIGIWDQFYLTGLDITYTSIGRNGTGGIGGYGRGGNMPSYHTIITSTDENGANRGFLGNEANWRVIKDLESRNMLVPVVGNFGGKVAIKSVATWLKDRNATVTAFYASNVEQYLFQDGIAWNYYDNVAALPTDSTSVIIRSQGGGGGRGGFGGPGGMRGPNLLCSIRDLMAANQAGRINYYQDIFGYCQY